MNLIKINDLSITYKIGYKNIFALKNVSFDINSGDYICIIGNNGSGKSSLVKGLLNLVPISNGKIIKNCSKDEISYLPQDNSISLDFPATVDEIVLSGTQTNNNKSLFYTKENKKKSQIAMERAEITQFSKRRFGELSGGQQQRVLFARAIAKNPKILILDEPCTGLDPIISENFYKLLYKINSENNTTIIMVSHDINSVKKYASKIIVLNKKILFYGSSKEFENSAFGGNAK